MRDINNLNNKILIKRLLLVVLTLILLNPVILFLLTKNIFIGIGVPLFFIVILFVFHENLILKPLSIFLFNVIMVVSFFLHAEVIFTHSYSEYIIEDLYKINGKYYFNRPDLHKLFQDKEYSAIYKTNHQGFRIGAEDDSEVTVSQVDWLFLGDSYTQGAQVNYEELYTSILFNYFPDKIIVNAGISGFGIPEEFYYYITEGKKLKPRKVFLQICNFNDFMNVAEGSFGFSDYLMSQSNFARYILYGFKYANPAELPLGRWAEPFYPDEKSNEQYNIFYKKSDNKKKEDIKKFGYYLRKLNDAVVSSGSELIILQIPTKEQIYYKYFQEVVDGYNLNVDDLNMNMPNQLLDSICTMLNIKHLDLMPSFYEAGKDLFFEFDEHLNIDGHQQIAASLRDFLIRTENYPDNIELLSVLNSGDRYPNFAGNNYLSFQSLKDRNMELFLSDSLMNSIKRITWNNVDESHPWISPDIKKIVFTEGKQENQETNIIMMNLDGTDRINITNDPGVFGAIPSFSTDGSMIAYAEWHYNEKNARMTNPFITVLNVQNGEKTVLIGDTVESWRPVFSHDNYSLFFISKISGQFDIFEYKFMDASIRNITNTPWDEWDPAISPDGRFIVYAARENDNWNLYHYDLLLATKNQITSGIGNEWDPSFSPCGNYIYYAGVSGLRNGIFRLKLIQ